MLHLHAFFFLYFFLNREVKGSKEKVISDKDLELLLDRSDLIGKSEFLSMLDNEFLVLCWFFFNEFYI